jgi:hypothetical protein
MDIRNYSGSELFLMREILNSLIPAIREIDGGCDNCIENFMSSSNLGFLRKKIPFHFSYGWEYYDVVLLDNIPQEKDLDVYDLKDALAEGLL